MNRTQGQRLIALLKQRAMTYMEMYQTGISTSPHKRIMETLDLPDYEGWRLMKYRVKGRPVRWRVVPELKR